MKKEIEDYINAINSAEFIVEKIKYPENSQNNDTNDHMSQKDEVYDVINKFSNKDTLSKSLKDINKNALSKSKNVEKLMLSAMLIKKKNNRNRYILAISSVAAAFTMVSLLIYSNYSSSNSEIYSPIEVKSEVAELNTKEPILILNSGEKINVLSNKEEVENLLNQKLTIGQAKEVRLEYNTLIIPSKHTYMVVLPDGSEVTVNANSKLIYPTNFAGNTREVFLEGEAYFKVEKGNKPFIVNNSGIKINVYGTEFNVNTIDENTIETVLVSGSLGVSNKINEHITKIKPNQKSLFNIKDNSNTVSNVDPKDYLSWMSDYFMFNGEKLVDVIYDFEKWYGVDMKFLSKEYKDIIITGSFSKETALDQILLTIGKTVKLSFIKKDGIYVIE